MKKIAVASVLVLLGVAACDAENDLPESEVRIAEVDDAHEVDDDDHHGPPPHVRDREHRNPVDRLCNLVSCTDDQREQIAGLLRDAKKDRKEGRGTMKAANAKLAEAFRSEAFTADALAAHHRATSQLHEERAAAADRVKVEIHGLLTAEQRKIVADTIEKRGPGVLTGRGHGGKGKHHGDHAGKDARDRDGSRAKRDPAKRAAKIAMRICDPLECSDEQHAEITTLLAEARPPKPEDHRETAEQGKKELADAFRSADFSADVLAKHRATMKAHKEAGRAKMDETLLRLHSILEPEQRDKVAERIERRGPHLLRGKGMGKRRGHKRRHRGGPKDYEG